MRIFLDEVHYEMTQKYEVNTGRCNLFPGGLSFDEASVHITRVAITATG